MTARELIEKLNKELDNLDVPIFVQGSSAWFDAKASIGACRIEDAEGEMGYVFGVLISPQSDNERG